MDKKNIKNEITTHSKYSIGLRTIKTSLAVFICLAIHFFAGSVSAGLYACIAAIVCMRETQTETWEMGLHRAYGTLIGGALGFGLAELVKYIPGYFDGIYVILLPVGLIICIWLCMLIDKKNGVIIGCVVFIGIGLDPTMMSDAGNTLQDVMLRMGETIVGILVAGLLNRYFFPPKKAPEEQ